MRRVALLVVVALAGGVRAADRALGGRPPATVQEDDRGDAPDDLDALEEEPLDEDEDLRALPPIGPGEERDRALDEPARAVRPPAVRTGPAEPALPAEPVAPE